MRRLFLILTCMLFIGGGINLFGQTFSPEGRKVGFGIMFGDPTGATLKLQQETPNAYVIDLGSSYFGSPRINVDYLWEFNAFNNNMFNLYAGPGVALGFGKGHGVYYSNNTGSFYYRTSGLGLGVRGVFGLNFIPQNTPLEIYLEAGLLVGISPDFGSAMDVGLGIRFYP
jgi:hypothetical protein